MSNESLSVAGLFAGIGGIELGFQQAGFRIAVANEIDEYAVKTYKHNYSHKIIHSDIAELNADELPEDLTVLTGGFPCQPFSVAGYRRGFDDERGNVYWEIERLFLKTEPEVIFLENVKNLLTHDSGNTYKTIQKSLEDAGYHVTYKIMNAKEYGNIPQNRERIYIVAFKSEAAFNNFEWPAPIPLTSKLSDFIDFDSRVADKYYYTPERPFYDSLLESIIDSNTIYQWRRQYVRANKSGDCPTLTANMGMGGHNVPLILSKYGIRKLTPEECFNLMGFPELKRPDGIAESRLYKQAGNAVVVPVIERIASSIKVAIEKSK